MSISVPDYILNIDPYVPGKPLEALEREYGIADSIKLASNENPLGPSPKALQAVQKAISQLHRYPDGGGYYLTQKLAAHLGVRPGNIVIGNGSDDILGMLVRAFLRQGDEAIMPKPSFLMYDLEVRCSGARSVPVALKAMSIDLEAILDRITPRCRMIFLCSPNNPTGSVLSKQDFEHFLAQVPPDIMVVVDEAYVEFVRDPLALNSTDYFHENGRLVTLRTFSKAYGLAGLRVGYGIMPEYIARILSRVRQPFNVNSLGQIAAAAALEDSEFLEKTLSTIHHGLDYLFLALKSLPVRHFPTQANFFLIDVKKSADDLFESLLKRGVIVRSMSSYGYPDHIRVNVGLPEENRRFIQTLKQAL